MTRAATLAGLLAFGTVAIGLTDPDTDDPQSFEHHVAVPTFTFALIATAVALAYIRNRTGVGSSALALVVGLFVAGSFAVARVRRWRWLGGGLVLLAIGVIVGESPGFALVGLTWFGVALLRAPPAASPASQAPCDPAASTRAGSGRSTPAAKAPTPHPDA